MNFVDLNGLWTLSNDDKNISVTASVPGCVHTDLLKAKVIEDPFYRDNEFTQMWVCYEDWTYTGDFQIEKSFLENNS